MINKWINVTKVKCALLEKTCDPRARKHVPIPRDLCSYFSKYWKQTLQKSFYAKIYILLKRATVKFDYSLVSNSFWNIWKKKHFFPVIQKVDINVTILYQTLCVLLHFWFLNWKGKAVNHTCRVIHAILALFDSLFKNDDFDAP